MLTGNVAFKAERAAVWADIARIRADMDRLSSSWTDPANIEKWANFKSTLDEFEVAQRQVEEIAHTVDEHPATKILFEDAAPRASTIIKAITAMIDAEGKLPATPERKALLGMMADVRGSMGMGLANIRAYLLSGDEKFKTIFEKFWATNERRFGDLGNNAHLFTAEQQASFKALKQARTEFALLPTSMFEIRGSKKWNMANYLLITEAAPRGGALLTTLAGEKQDNGARTGGMVANQKNLLAVDADATAENAGFLKTIEWILLFSGIAIAAVVTFFTARSIVDPVKTMTDAMGRLAQGDISINVPARERTDELGDMAQAMQVFKDSAIENARMTEAQKEEQETQKARAQRLDDLTSSFDAQISNALESVDSAATSMKTTAESMASTAEETSNQSQAAAAASEQASNNVQMVSAAAEEMSASVEEIARQVGDSAMMAQSAVEQAETTNSEVQGLVETAQKIGNVVEMITDIAAQTNLLALNATIEAARAGEAGKGFAVVATEVKSLANQTAKATDEIAKQIGAMQGATANSVEAIQAIVDKISEMNEVSSAIAAAIDEQEAATRNISENSQQAATGTQEATGNVNGVSSAASETGMAATDVLRAAGSMSDQAETLRQSVDTFLRDVKAA
jgi:methyl-accepting chemotaxis protein